MEYECVQCFREFETDPGEEPCEECRVENEARKKAWPHRVFDEDWDQCKAWPGDWECGYDTTLGGGCHECRTGQLVAKVAELEKRAVPGIVADELARQESMWGADNDDRHSPSTWARILREEFDEVIWETGGGRSSLCFKHHGGQLMSERDPERLAEELAHLAAVAISWVRAIDRAIAAAEEASDDPHS